MTRFAAGKAPASYVVPPPVVEYIAHVPSVSFVFPAPVVAYVTSAPAMFVCTCQRPLVDVLWCGHIPLGCTKMRGDWVSLVSREIARAIEIVARSREQQH